MLTISLLGQSLMTLNSAPMTGFSSYKASILLAYLAVESDRPHDRPALAALFWPEQTDAVARKNLRDILFNLQKVMGNREAEPPYLIVTRHSVQFNKDSDHWLDVEAFTTLLTACETHRHKRIDSCRVCAARLQQAIDLYRGDFLTGTFINDSRSFENWLALNRERLLQQALEALYHLTRFHARRQEFAQARRFAQRQVELAPWLEVAYRQLMALSALAGHRGAALAQFETCRQRLAEELAVEPGPETVALYEQIKAGRKPIRISSLPINPQSQYQIPAQTTTFLGRKQELLQIADYLQDPECRLLTLIGPGGSGKTRLAVQVMAEEIANFEDGIFFVPLAALESADLLPLAIADGMNLSLSGPRPPREQVLIYLHEKELLLVLDNFESLLGDERAPEALDLLVDILKNAPRVVMLVTSRQPVGFQAERLFDLYGLPYPPAGDEGNAEQWDAVQLFWERARRIQPQFNAAPETIAHICRLVEGLPLGIELASAWARTMTGAQILEAINQSVDALATTRRDVPARHRSLRATFTYSWAMLSPEEQRVFCDLSVFRGGFTAAATPASLQMLSSLVEKSLLRQDADGRYQMHELLRQFGEEKLRQHPEAEAIARNHHCAWVADFLQQWDTALRGKRQMEAVEQIGAEIDNIRTGWQWAVKNGKEAEISRSFRAIAQFFDIRGWFQEGESMFAKAAAALPEKGVLYGRLLGYQAGFNYRSGRYERAQSLFEETLTLFLQLNEPDESAFVLNGLGALASFRGQYAEAKQHAKKSLAIARKTNDPYEESKSLDVLGIAARYNGQLSEAKAYFQASLIIHQNHGDLFGLARSYNHLGNTAFAEKEYDNAITLFTQAMEICRKIDYRFVIPYLLNNLGISAGHMKKYDESIQYFSEGLALFQKLGDQFGEGLVYGNLGHIFESAGENAKAAKHFKSAIRIGLELGSPALVLDALTGIATLLAKDDEMQQALELATLIMHHSATRKETKQKAEALSNQLMDALPSDQVASALAKGEALRLTEISAKILA